MCCWNELKDFCVCALVCVWFCKLHNLNSLLPLGRCWPEEGRPLRDKPQLNLKSRAKVNQAMITHKCVSSWAEENNAGGKSLGSEQFGIWHYFCNSWLIGKARQKEFLLINETEINFKVFLVFRIVPVCLSPNTFTPTYCHCWQLRSLLRKQFYQECTNCELLRKLKIHFLPHFGDCLLWAAKITKQSSRAWFKQYISFRKENRIKQIGNSFSHRMDHQLPGLKAHEKPGINQHLFIECLCNIRLMTIVAVTSGGLKSG